MGKKRRILTRTAKFAKKYFEFLDAVDATTNVPESGGEESDDVLERVDPFIDTISIVDNKNQTITVTGTVIGNVPGMGNAAAQRVEVSVDGAPFQESGQIGSAGSGIGKFTYSHTTTGASAHGKSLKVVVRPKGSTSTDVQKSARIKLVQNAIELAFTAGDQAGDAFRNDETPDNIKLDASDITIVSGKKKAGDTNNAVLGGAGAHAVGIRIEVFLATDTARANGQILTGGNAFLDIPAATNPFAGADDDSILASNITADTDFVIRVTPFSADDTPVLLTESAQERTLSVAKA
tara:strand:+ start:1046 stop:1924 length:879 start_codon:yes stop_codon:yes gene_type:complete